MDKQREKFVNEMKRIEEALNNTTSPCLKRDYKKALINMQKELKDYDKFKQQAEVIR